MQQIKAEVTKRKEKDYLIKELEVTQNSQRNWKNKINQKNLVIIGLEMDKNNSQAGREEI